MTRVSIEKEQLANDQVFNVNGMPEGWTFGTLQDIVGPGGILTDGDWVETKDQDPEGDVRLIQLADIGDGSYKNKSQRYLTSKKAKELGCTFLHSGDVLIARLPDPLGRSCIFPGDTKPAVTAVDVCIVRTGKYGADHHWIIHTVNSPVIRRQIGGLQRGTTRARISRKNLISIKLLIPPLAEQKRIVAKVEEMLVRVNAARERLAKVKDILKRFRQSVLAAACSGHLTAEWRNWRSNERTRVHPITQGTDLKESSTSLVTEELSEMPETWHWLPLQDVSDYQGGFAFKSRKFLSKGRNQVIRIGNVRLGYIDLSIAPVFIDDQYAAEKSLFQLRENDLLISMTGTKYKRDYGFVGLVPSSDRILLLNQRVGRLRCKGGCMPLYLYYWLGTETYRDFFFKNETGNVNQGNVGADALKLAPASIPPVTEQEKIICYVEALFKLADAIEKRVVAAMAQAEKMTQAILAKAFLGELVPAEAEMAQKEGRSYEPASALLAKIKAQRKDIAPHWKRKRSR